MNDEKWVQIKKSINMLEKVANIIRDINDDSFQGFPETLDDISGNLQESVSQE